MELTGTVHKVMPSVSGTSTHGTWKRQELIMKTLEQFPKTIAFEFSGDRCSQLDSLKPGNNIKVSFHIESQEYEGKYYNKVKAWNIVVLGI